MTPTVGSVTAWKPQVAPMAWRGGRIYYHRTGQGVVAEGYSCLPDGTDERLETGSPSYPVGTNQSVEDVSPDGRYALVTVERSGHAGNPDGYPGAAPGKGTYNDLWLLDLTSGLTWKLVDLLVTKSTALIWPRFDSTGTRVVWSELTTVHWYDLGIWTLFAADLSLGGAAPTLSNRRSYRGAGFVEAYGFVDGDQAVLAAAGLTGLSGWNPQIAKFPVTASGIAAPKRLSPKTPDEAWAVFQNYCEFAYPMPGFPGRIMYGRMFGMQGGSLEFWTMKDDGTDHVQLTRFSDPKSPQYQGSATAILGGIAWDPDDPKRFVVGVALDSNAVNMRALMVTLA